MTLYMETTKISAEKTVAQIQEVLGKNGADQILIEYDHGEVVGICFRVFVSGKSLPFRMPCKWEPIFEHFLERRTNMVHDEKALDVLTQKSKRVAWRQILRWVEAQMAMIQTSMVKMHEVFLPYLQTGINETLFQKLEKEQFKALPMSEG